MRRDYLDGSWNWDICGNCKHHHLSHTNWSEVGSGKLEWVERCRVTHYGPSKLEKQCSCTEWVPKDNLDLIEFLAEKRNLV